MEEPGPFGPGNPDRPSLRYLLRRFLRYGLLAWGGPVAQIALMHREIVERDGWIDEDRFRKTLALYQALPGPEALELAVYFGMTKRGRWGGLLAGLGFMLPGLVFVTSLAALYVAYRGTVGAAEAILYGVRPAVVALVVVGFLHLLRRTVTTAPLLVIAASSAVVTLAWPSVNFLAILAAGGVVAGAIHVLRKPSEPASPALALIAFAWLPFSAGGLGALALVMAQVGLLTFGGAYTAIPFLHEGAVETNHWVTEKEFLDAIALSGMVPGPLITVGVFVGYQAAGLAGAALSALLIFVPAFVFTLVGHRFFERIVHEPRLHAFLLGITAAVIGLIAGAVVPLSRAAFLDGPTIAIGLLGAAVLFWRRANIPVVIVAAAVVGYAAQWAAARY